jgi:hypothetical protein
LGRGWTLSQAESVQYRPAIARTNVTDARHETSADRQFNKSGQLE